MISRHVGNLLSPDQLSRWDRSIANLRGIEARDRDDPIVFHGTSSLVAAHILRDGFDPSFLRTVAEEMIATYKPPWPTPADGVHWGSVNIAAWAVNRRIAEDDRPVLLYARASDVVASGIAVPDWMALEQCMARPYEALAEDHYAERLPYDADWRQCLDRCGAFGVIGGRHVANLQVFDPLADMPVHPEWQRNRDRRLEPPDGPWSVMVQPPPGHVEPTPETHPPTWSARDAAVAVWGEANIRSGEIMRGERPPETEPEEEPAPGFR